jgi:transposase
MGRSRGGLTTKIHALTDARGLPLELVLTPGQAGDCPVAAQLLALPSPSIAFDRISREASGRIRWRS